MNRWNNILRYGRRFHHVFQVGTHEIATAVEGALAKVGETYSSLWDSASDSPGFIKDGKMLVKAFRQGLPGEKFTALKLPDSLTSATRPTMEMVRRPDGPLWVPTLVQMGHPRPAYSFHNLDDGRSKVARICVSWIGSADMPPSWMERRGRALAALLGALKKADFEVELRALYMGTVQHTLATAHASRVGPAGRHPLQPSDDACVGRGQDVCIDIPIHYPGKHLDVARVAAVLGQKGAIQKGLWPWRGMTFGVAWFAGLNDEEKGVEEYFLEKGWIYIPSMYHQNSSGHIFSCDSNAIEWIAKCLHGFGVVGGIED